MTFAQKYPALSRCWAWLASDSTLLLVMFIVGVVKDRQTLIGFSFLGLLIIKYGNKPKG
jgi:hypothetical protein